MNNKQLLDAISGLLTDEQKVALTTILATSETEEVDSPKVIVDDDFGEVPSMTIAEVKNMNVRKGIFIPGKPKEAKFGTTKQVDKKTGLEFDYIRSEFDGEEGVLDEQHMIMKEDFITYSKAIRQIVRNFDGAGDTAITMYQPDISTRKDGKVFYRWDNPAKTSPLMDQLWKFVIQAKEEEGE